jgi:hypothetical protein
MKQGLFNAVKLRRCAFDISVAYTPIFDMPIELGLELMAVVNSDFLDTERKFFNNLFLEIDGTDLFRINSSSSFRLNHFRSKSAGDIPPIAE